MKFAWVLVSLGSLGIGTLASADLSSKLQARMREEKITSLTFAANTSDASLSASIGAHGETQFWSASMTKMLTAVAIHQLEEDGLLRLDDPVVSHLTWWNQHPSPQARRVTIRHLLTHTSGLTRDNGIDFWMNAERTERDHAPTVEELQSAFPGQEFVFTEGTELKYSNLGYEILGLIVAKLSPSCQGPDLLNCYSAAVTERILRPLGMKDSGFWADAQLLKQFSAPLGLIDHSSGVRAPLPLLSTAGVSMPAWGLHSTAHDFSKFIREIGFAAQGKPNRLFKSDRSRLISEPVRMDPTNPKEGYSHGFIVRMTPSGKIVGHTGTFLGHRSIAFAHVDQDLSAVVYVNATDVNREYYLNLVFAAMDGRADPTVPTSKPLPEGRDYTRVLGIEGRYTSPFGIIDVYHREGKLTLLQGSQEFTLTILENGTDAISARVGGVGTYTLWTGEKLVFEMDPETRRPRKLIAANSYRYLPIP